MGSVTALRLAPLAGLVLAVVAAAPAGAGAATLSGEVTVPVDSAGSPARDITRISSSYDPAAGTWTEAIRFAGPLTTDDKAMFYSTLVACSSGTPGLSGAAGAEPGVDADVDRSGRLLGRRVRHRDRRRRADVRRGVRPGDEAGLGPRTLTLTLTDPLLVGRDVPLRRPVPAQRVRHGLRPRRHDRAEAAVPARGGDGGPGAPSRAGRRPGPGLRRPDRDDLPAASPVPRRGRPRLTARAPLGAGTGGSVVVRRRRRWPRARERPLPVVRRRRGRTCHSGSPGASGARSAATAGFSSRSTSR